MYYADYSVGSLL